METLLNVESDCVYSSFKAFVKTASPDTPPSDADQFGKFLRSVGLYLGSPVQFRGSTVRNWLLGPDVRDTRYQPQLSDIGGKFAQQVLRYTEQPDFDIAVNKNPQITNEGLKDFIGLLSQTDVSICYVGPTHMPRFQFRFSGISPQVDMGYIPAMDAHDVRSGMLASDLDIYSRAELAIQNGELMVISRGFSDSYTLLRREQTPFFDRGVHSDALTSYLTPHLIKYWRSTAFQGAHSAVAFFSLFGAEKLSSLLEQKYVDEDKWNKAPQLAEANSKELENRKLMLASDIFYAVSNNPIVSLALAFKYGLFAFTRVKDFMMDPEKRTAFFTDFVRTYRMHFEEGTSQVPSINFSTEIPILQIMLIAQLPRNQLSGPLVFVQLLKKHGAIPESTPETLETFFQIMNPI